MTISNCGRGESGYTNQQAGDQTGKEWYLRSWYSKPWSCVLRHPDATIREDISNLAVMAANNDCVGYDQGDRTTFWQQLEACNYDPSRITVKCESDCSSGVAAIVKAVGFRQSNTLLRGVSKDCWTGNLRAALKDAGFEVLTSSKYLTTDSELVAGDILLNDGSHTCINVSNLGVVGDHTSSDGKIAVDGYAGPATVTLWQQIMGTTVDGFVSGQDAGDMATVNRGGLPAGTWVVGYGGSELIRAVQKVIGAKVDGYAGTDTFTKLQIYMGTTVDGVIDAGSTCIKALQTRLNEGWF